MIGFEFINNNRSFNILEILCNFLNMLDEIINWNIVLHDIKYIKYKN